VGGPGELRADQHCVRPCVGPPTGSLLLAGGGTLDPEVFERFVDLAGGPRATIVVIPTAGRSERYTSEWIGVRPFHDAGARHVTVLHTRSSDEAESDAFAETIREASGVWLTGGRPWRLVDAYKGTRVEDELHLLLARGGVIGGTSAGASIMASYLVRGAPDDNAIVMTPEYDAGFDFLRGTAVDQHIVARDREKDLFEVLEANPGLLGIGLDEGAALVVQGDRAEVVGEKTVAIYDPHADRTEYAVLWPGITYDLGARRWEVEDGDMAALLEEGARPTLGDRKTPADPGDPGDRESARDGAGSNDPDQ